MAPAPRLAAYLLTGWLLLNLLQAGFTELFHDEAFYWMYSRQLDWGYAEHAPLVALVIRVGTALLPGEWGVRLLPVLLNAGTIWLLYQTLKPRDPLFFFLLVFSVAGIHVAGFLAVPDASLLFFVALFFYRYSFFVEKDDLRNSLWLLLAVVGILYSKYQGIMVLFFTLLSFPALLRRRSFWGLALAAFLLYLPHLAWLHRHEYATFVWHLLEREKGGYRPEFTLAFLANQILLAGPLTGILLLAAPFLAKSRDLLERAWTFTAVGILVFLLLLTLRTYVEANWAASALIPLLALGYRRLVERERLRAWTVRLAIPGLVLLLVLRLYLVFDFMPPLRKIRKEFHGWPEWAAQIDSLAAGRPVVFANSYQFPSKYAFYTGGKRTHGHNTAMYHRTQYDLWNTEAAVQGKSVCYVSTYPIFGGDTLVTAKNDVYYYRIIDDFRTLSRIGIEVTSGELAFSAGDTARISLRLINGYEAPVIFHGEGRPAVRLVYHIVQQGKPIFMAALETPLPLDRLVDTATVVAAPVFMPAVPGDYEILFSLFSDGILLGINGRWEGVGVGSRESGVGSRETGVGSRELGDGSWESGDRCADRGQTGDGN